MTPTDSLFYDLRVLHITQFLYVSALLCLHLQGVDMKTQQKKQATVVNYFIAVCLKEILV